MHMDNTAAAVIALSLLWLCCAAVVIGVLANKEDPLLTVLFPGSSRKRKIVGTGIILFSPISLLLFIATVVIYVLWLIVKKFILWIAQTTGMTKEWDT